MDFKHQCLDRVERIVIRNSEKVNTGHGVCLNPDHLKYKRQIDQRTCSKCTEHDRLKSRRVGGIGLKSESSRIPSERSRKGSGEPPTITPDGTLIYVKEGWEPPLCPPGYRRRSNDMESPDAWVLEPEEPLCRYIKIVIGESGSCGCRRVTPMCGYHEEPTRICFRACLKCSDRETGYGETS